MLSGCCFLECAAGCQPGPTSLYISHSAVAVDIQLLSLENCLAIWRQDVLHELCLEGIRARRISTDLYSYAADAYSTAADVYSDAADLYSDAADMT